MYDEKRLRQDDSSVLPSGSPTGHHKAKGTSTSRATKVVGAGLALVALLRGYQPLASLISPALGDSTSYAPSTCLQAPALPGHIDNRTDFVFGDARFKEKQVERFLGAIRIPTQSFDDMVDTPISGEGRDRRRDSLLVLHDYLAASFPLVHASAKLEKPNVYNLVFTLQGSDPSLKPLVLAAHQDVVPAETSLERWTYPPFQGVLADGFIYGRGSTDCKNSLIAILAGVEHLLENGWTNTRPLVLAFGFDEEIGGPQGARAIGKLLLETYGKDGVAMIVDEGGAGVEVQYGKTFVMPATGEKGNISPIIVVETDGGHSSTPAAETSISLLSRIIVAVVDGNLFPPTLHTYSPIYSYLSCVATHGSPPLVPSWIKNAFKKNKRQSQKDLDALAAAFATDRGRMKGEFLVRTSAPATLISGGHKVNALPESASVTFNSRIDFSQSPSEVLEIYSRPILPLALQHNLTLVAANGTTLHKGGQGVITIRTSAEKGLAPAPVTPVSGTAWDIFGWASQRIFQRHGGEVIVAPSSATGNTDTKHYWSLSRNIYRFVPRRDGTSFNAHTVDERLLFETHLESLAWYLELILFADAVESDQGW